MLTPTADQVRTLAPDGSAARAGEGLAQPRRWSGSGRTETAAWGLCQGSGSSPYQVAVDLAGPAYRCSCPSSKIPCKHALGLLFLLAGGAVKETEPPDWVAEWLAARAARAAAAAARAERTTEADPAARAKRVESRERKVAAGIDELDRWLGDLMRRGLDSARGEGYRFWDGMGARLVDAQAGGLGRSVRGLGSAASAGEAWPHLLLEGAARLHLLCEAYRRRDELPAGLRADVRSLVGWTTREEDLDPADGVADRWLVVGRRVDDTGQVITARTFLLGESSARFALHLAFGVDAAPPTVLGLPGQAFRATLVYFPSATPLRAALRPILEPDGEVVSVPATGGVDDVLRGHAERLALNPFSGAWPVALRDVTPVLRGERLLVPDERGASLPVVPAGTAPRLLAVSGGHPVTVVGEWDGASLRPLSVFAESRIVDLDAGDAGDARDRTGDREHDPGWSELVSAALLGIERAGDRVTVPDVAAGLVTSADGRDRERTLLTAAGVLAVRRRAGRRPVVDTEPPPAPAAPDPRPALTGPAARLLGRVLAEERAVLPESLALVRASGRRVPDEWLPELLAIASSDAAVGMAIAEVSGARAAWLGAVVPELAGALPDVDRDWDVAWDEARGATQRAALIRAMRRTDRVAARDSLARWLPDLAGDERAIVVEALDERLGPDDEPAVAPLLGDRRIDVRRAAAGLLARIPGSAFAQLVESRARPLLAAKGTLRPGLGVGLPTLDAELEAVGFGGGPPTGVGERAWLLRRLVGLVRPYRWTEWLRADASDLVERALRSEEGRAVLDGWLDAATHFGDGSWLSVLVGEPKVADTMRLDPARALAALPPLDRAAVATAAARNVDPATLANLTAVCPPLWTSALVDAVFAIVKDLAASQYPDQAVYALVRAAALGIPPQRADELAKLASYQDEVRPALEGAIETVRLRAALHDAFAALPPP